MSHDVKGLFIAYLTQLDVIVGKVPDELFSLSLVKDMFSLEMNAKIAANFLLRGYCPLASVELESFYREDSGKASVLKQIAKTKAYLDAAKEINNFDDSKTLTDNAGLTEVALPQSHFIHQ